MAKNTDSLKTFDPYDLWSTPTGVKAREWYYQGKLTGKISAVMLGVLDWLTPHISRKLTKAQPRNYPIVIAHEVLRLQQLDQLDESTAESLLALIISSATQPDGHPTWSWGLGFSWMSKNGLYPDNIPFVTHTPYVMEALLVLAEYPKLKTQATQMFESTWDFLKSLKIMHEEGNQLALSYAPIDEPRIVVNANSYAAYSFAMHALYGAENNKQEARNTVTKLVNWVVAQQQKNGSWDYYADSEPGNFIDTFHSCFVVKNLLKTQQLLPEITSVSDQAINKGWHFIQESLYDKQKGLCHRFIEKHIKDPYIWDLYDQAEYLSLLIKMGEIEQAKEFEKSVIKHFKQGGNYYCRIDMFGRRWGKNFQRWGIAPFNLAQSRMPTQGKSK